MSDYNVLIDKIVADHTTAVKIEKLGGLSQKNHTVRQTWL